MHRRTGTTRWSSHKKKPVENADFVAKLKELKEASPTPEQKEQIQATIDMVEATRANANELKQSAADAAKRIEEKDRLEEESIAAAELLKESAKDLPPGVDPQPDGSLYCRLCDKVVKSKSGLPAHVGGTKHMDKLALQEERAAAIA